MKNKAFTPISALIGALLLTLVAAMSPFVAERNLAYAQTADSTAIEYAENGEAVVAAFTATDPEGATSITWSLATNAELDGVEVADVADSENHFTIDEDGILKFSSPPDFENPSGEGDAATNTYKVVVLASDAATDGMMGYHKVTVEVTNVNEPGKLTLVTSTTDGTPQYLVGATLTATASDGDITDVDQNFTGDTAGEVTGVTWRWYRGGTEITGAQSNTYTLLAADAGQHIRAVVYYIVTGNVDQESASLTTDYPVLAARVGANELEFDPAAVSRTISEGDKGRNVGAPVTATGNHGTVRYSLEAGGDDANFMIDEKTGQITIEVELNYEAAADAADNCATTQNSCTVTVTATDSTGENIVTDATVTITITDVDETPAFSDAGSQTVGVPENSTDLFSATADGYSVNAVTGVTYTAMDPEEHTVNYSLMGPDASKFQLSGSPPVLSFASKPDFEAKASADGDNVYEVTVRASVGGDTGERMVRVTVGDVNEGPDVSGPSAMNFAENGEAVVAAFTATDPEGATSITWSLATNADLDGVEVADVADSENHFTIDEDGILKFSSPPDFENPSGEGDAATNTYKVVVLASDAATDGMMGYHKVTVEVTNVNEPGKITLATSTSEGTPQYLVGATLTATASDGDITNATQTFISDTAGEVTGVTWRWYRGGTEITGADAQDNTYTLLAADENHRIRATVTYRVGANTNQESASLTTDYPVLAARVGANELEFDPAAVSRTISEGDKGRNVGAPVTATGNHGTVRYSLEAGGDDANFMIDEKTGQITIEVELNYEAAADAADNCATTQNSCTVTVTATDSTGENIVTDATVTITITDVDETPAFSDAGSQTVGVPENSTDLFSATADGYSVNAVTGVTYTAMDPEGRTVNYSLMGPDSSKFQIKGSPPVLSFASKPDFEAKASADGDNVYEVTVRASVGGDTGERMVRVTAGDVNEGPVISVGASIRGQSSISYAENGTDDVGSYEAAGLEAGATVSWSLSGDDAGEFNISSGGVLTFASPPDFESPADANSDNVYMVTVRAGAATLAVAITVTDEDEMVVVPGDSLLERYDDDRSGRIDRDEVIAAIDDYLFGVGDEKLTRPQVIEVIDLYLFGG